MAGLDLSASSGWSAAPNAFTKPRSSASSSGSAVSACTQGDQAVLRAGRGHAVRRDAQADAPRPSLRPRRTVGGRAHPCETDGGAVGQLWGSRSAEVRIVDRRADRMRPGAGR
jgi:hypothetical protein